MSRSRDSLSPALDDRQHRSTLASLVISWIEGRRRKDRRDSVHPNTHISNFSLPIDRLLFSLYDTRFEIERDIRLLLSLSLSCFIFVAIYEAQYTFQREASKFRLAAKWLSRVTRFPFDSSPRPVSRIDSIPRH